MNARITVFWSAATLGGWVLLGYPTALAALRPRPVEQRNDELPLLSVIVPAYREREELARKLEALRGVDYPRDRVEVLVAVDGDARLAEIAREAWPEAHVLFSAERAGKSAALNRAMAAVTGDVVVLTDANNLLHPESLRAAARYFGDPEVWAVAGRRRECRSAYDRYEDLLRRLETRSGSVAAASGEFFAVRRERVPRFPADVINDDLWLLCQLVRGGGRVVYEPAARSIEPPLPVSAEISRRSRIGAGRVTLMRELRGLPPGFAFRLMSHKHGRLALPFVLVSMLTASLSLSTRQPYRAFAVGQLALYGLGVSALAGRAPSGSLGRVAYATGQFLLGNYAVGVGVLRALRGRQGVRWDPVR